MQAPPPAFARPCRLAVAGLACRRGDRLLLRGIDFALEPGQALHLAGPNGIGKSSLIRILAGLLRPYAGTVERSGELALADERTALDPQQPLGQALGFWRRFDGLDGARLETAMHALALAELASVPVRYLSTGQRKRAVLARVLAGQAPIWLLDEPLNGLDAAACASLARIVSEHGQAGGISVIASHQPIAVSGLARLELGRHAPCEAEA